MSTPSKERKIEKIGIFSDTCHSRIVVFFYFYFFSDFKDKFRLELILLKLTLKKRNKQFVKFPFVKISIDVVVVVNADEVVAIVVNETKKISKLKQPNQFDCTVKLGYNELGYNEHKNNYLVGLGHFPDELSRL
jgi:hypothetical protein